MFVAVFVYIYMYLFLYISNCITFCTECFLQVQSAIMILYNNGLLMIITKTYIAKDAVRDVIFYKGVTQFFSTWRHHATRMRTSSVFDTVFFFGYLAV